MGTITSARRRRVTRALGGVTRALRRVTRALGRVTRALGRTTTHLPMGSRGMTIIVRMITTAPKLATANVTRRTTYPVGSYHWNALFDSTN